MATTGSEEKMITPQFIALRQALFDVIKETPAFLLAKAELRVLEKSQNNTGSFRELPR
ncbi:MAG TPA: hypothetical protein VEY10_09305 [Flavisolibacter sp.]|nr:hypothetical protein [Flavisolibacter sp.]